MKELKQLLEDRSYTRGNVNTHSIFRLFRKLRRSPLEQYRIDLKKEKAQGATLNHSQNVFVEMRKDV